MCDGGLAVAAAAVLKGIIQNAHLPKAVREFAQHVLKYRSYQKVHHTEIL